MTFGPITGRPTLTAELDAIRANVIGFARKVEVDLEQAIWALRTHNVDLCTAVIEGDAEFNELHHEIRQMCFHVVLTQAPVARDLRDLLAFEHMSSELERMADHCVSIARISRSIADLPDRPSSDPLGTLAERCENQLQDIIGAIEANDRDRAREIALADRDIDTQYRQIFSNYVDAMASEGNIAVQATGLVFVAHYLERIGDRVSNMAEELIFAETGTLEELGGN